MTTSLHRRKFLIGLLAAPAIVHAGNLMPIKALAREATRVWEDYPYYCYRPPDASWPRKVVHADGRIPWIPRHWISDIIITPTTEVGPDVVPLL